MTYSNDAANAVQEGARKLRVPVLRVNVVREGSAESPCGNLIRSPRDIAILLRHFFDGEEREHHVALLLDTRNRIKAIVPVSVGNLDSAIVHPRETFRAAILYGAASIVVVHNHPTGNPSPSPEDIACAKRLKECGELLGIELLDSVIVGDNSHTSLKETGYLTP